MSEPVSGVLLAAGPSERFGQDPPKQLATLGGETLVRRAARQALRSRLSQVLVVVGWASQRVRAALEGLAVEVVENRRFAEGQSSSVRVGLAAVSEAAAAAVFVPVDQPALTAALIDDLIDLWRRSGGAIVVPSHANRRGAPVLFDRSLFAELAHIHGDQGGRQLFARHADRIIELRLADGGPLVDVDTLDDLRRFGG